MSAIVSVLVSHVYLGRLDITRLIFSALAGLVAITACANLVKPWVAVIIGFFAGVVFPACEHCVRTYLKVEDQLSVIAIHGGCGLYGVLVTGLFVSTENRPRQIVCVCGGFVLFRFGDGLSHVTCTSRVFR